MEEFAPKDKLARESFQVRKFNATTLIKSNSFAIECPAEVLQFGLKKWPEEKVWSHIRECTAGRAMAAVPLRDKVFALGAINEIKEAFGVNVQGPIERTPVSPTDLNYEDGAITSLMREALTRSKRPICAPMAATSCGNQRRRKRDARAPSTTRRLRPCTCS
jgi:hypothetical protein